MKNIINNKITIIMKNTILLILGLLIGACSSSDDDNLDQIIGVWKITKDVEVYTNGQEEVYIPSVCELKNRLTIKEDQTLFITNFPQSDDPNCEESIGGLYQSGTWTKLSEFKYKFVLNCMIPDCEPMTETPDEITFPNSNTMKVRINDTDSSDDLVYYYTEYYRVE